MSVQALRTDQFWATQPLYDRLLDCVLLAMRMSLGELAAGRCQTPSQLSPFVPMPDTLQNHEATARNKIWQQIEATYPNHSDAARKELYREAIATLPSVVEVIERIELYNRWVKAYNAAVETVQLELLVGDIDAAKGAAAHFDELDEPPS